jgi:diguanylate cyclase (GGDEF)-like protein
MLRAGFAEFEHGGGPFGVLWVTVDQSHELRKTHGAQACEGMMGKVRMALTHALRPADEMGRWGEDEFLILAHERMPETLDAHGRALAIAARTADFHWWGDKVPVTVSIGAAQAEMSETLVQLLERAQVAMIASVHEGGNRVTSAAREQA